MDLFEELLKKREDDLYPDQDNRDLASYVPRSQPNGVKFDDKWDQDAKFYDYLKNGGAASIQGGKVVKNPDAQYSFDEPSPDKVIDAGSVLRGADGSTKKQPVDFYSYLKAVKPEALSAVDGEIKNKNFNGPADAQRKKMQDMSDFMKDNNLSGASVKHSSSSSKMDPNFLKYLTGQRNLIDKGELDARKASDGIQLNSDLGKAFNTIGSSIAGSKADPSQYNDWSKNEQVRQDDLRADRQNQGKRLGDDAKLFQERQTQAEEMALKRETLKALGGKADPSFEKDVQKFGEKIQPMQNMTNLTKQFEDASGLKLDKTDTTGGVLRVNGKEVDLPGVNIPGMGRTTFYDSRAREMQAAAQAIFNQRVYDASGKAINENEMERLKEGFDAGRMNSEAELVKGIKDMNNLVKDAATQVQARFRPDVVKTYKDRGGTTADDINKPEIPSDYVRIEKDGKGRMVPAKNLQKWLSSGEGWVKK